MPYKDFHAFGMKGNLVLPLHDGDGRAAAQGKQQSRRRRRLDLRDDQVGLLLRGNQKGYNLNGLAHTVAKW